MKVRGLSWILLSNIAEGLDLSVIDSRELSLDLQFKIRARHSYTYYSRESLTGRSGPWVCFHGWRDFIRVCFANGATRIQTAQGTWKDVDAFDKDLPRMERLNVGSIMAPRTMPDLCTHLGGLPKMLRRAAQAVQLDSQTSSEGLARIAPDVARIEV